MQQSNEWREMREAAVVKAYLPAKMICVKFSKNLSIKILLFRAAEYAAVDASATVYLRNWNCVLACVLTQQKLLDA